MAGVFFRLVTMGLLVVSLLLPPQAKAASYLHTGEEAEAILKILDWSVWTNYGGKKDGRYIYVLTGWPGQ